MKKCILMILLKGKCTHFKNKIFILHDFRMYTDVNKKKKCLFYNIEIN